MSNVTRYVDGHGYFEVRTELMPIALRMPRAQLLAIVTAMYEGSSGIGSKGDKPTHWRGYSKETLALIATSENPHAFAVPQ